jgi:hypothetical protein
METLIKDRSEKLCLAKAAMEELASLVTQAGCEAVELEKKLLNWWPKKPSLKKSEILRKRKQKVH